MVQTRSKSTGKELKTREPGLWERNEKKCSGRKVDRLKALHAAGGSFLVARWCSHPNWATTNVSGSMKLSDHHEVITVKKKERNALNPKVEPCGGEEIALKTYLVHETTRKVSQFRPLNRKTIGKVRRVATSAYKVQKWTSFTHSEWATFGRFCVRGIQLRTSRLKRKGRRKPGWFPAQI